MAALPEGWVEGFDSRYNRAFYFHKPTKTSSWTPPTSETTQQKSNPPSASLSATLSSQKLSNPPVIRSKLTQPDSFTSPVAKKKPSAVDSQQVWSEVYSTQHGRNFYFNKLTKQSVWIDPRTPVAPQTVSAPPALAAKPLHSAGVAAASTFLDSSWETVGTHNKKPEFVAVSPIKPVFVPSIVSSNATSPPIVLNEVHPPLSLEKNRPPPPSMPTQAPSSFKDNLKQQSSTKRQFEEEDDKLGDELRSFTQNLTHEKKLISQHASILDPWGKKQLESLGEVESKPNLMTRMLSSSSTPPPSALTTWGVEPPKIIEVKRAMKDVEQGLKYANEELKAHGEAREEAKAVDAEGGYYSILGVSPNADFDAIKKAYRRGMIQNHPDKVSPENKERAQEKANMLQNAYACLSDEWERYCYDYFGLRKYLQNAKVVQCFKNYMLSGIEIIKHPRKGYPRRRFFWISPDFQWLMTGRERILEPTVEEMHEIKGVCIPDIHDISRGICTQVFERTGKAKKQSRYFSILTNDRTLDLEAESKERADFLVSRISLLVLDTQKNKKWLQRFFELKALKDAADAKSGGASFRTNTVPPPAPPPRPSNPKEDQEETN